MLSLQQLCLNKITEEILHAPPLIQELIVASTKKKMEDNIKLKLKEEHERNKTHILQSTEFLVSEIVQEHIFVRTHNHRNVKNFYETYPELPPECICTAMSIAESIIRDHEPRFFNVFQANPPHSWWEQAEDPTYDPDEDVLSNIDYPDEEQEDMDFNAFFMN